MENISKTSKSVSNTVNKPAQYGWIYPVCGRGNSPSTSTCPCKPINWELTCGPQWKYVYTTSTGTGGTINETR